MPTRIDFIQMSADSVDDEHADLDEHPGDESPYISGYWG